MGFKTPWKRIQSIYQPKVLLPLPPLLAKFIPPSDAAMLWCQVLHANTAQAVLVTENNPCFGTFSFQTWVVFEHCHLQEEHHLEMVDFSSFPCLITKGELFLCKNPPKVLFVVFSTVSSEPNPCDDLLGSQNGRIGNQKPRCCCCSIFPFLRIKTQCNWNNNIILEWTNRNPGWTNSYVCTIRAFGSLRL